VDRLKSIITLIEWMVRQFVEADLQADTMKLGPVASQSRYLYALTTIRVDRLMLYPYEELLAWAYTIELMQPLYLLSY